MGEEKREKNTQNERTTNINKNKTSIILEGNMIKNVKEWEMLKKLGDSKVFVKDFSCSKICVSNIIWHDPKKKFRLFVLHARMLEETAWTEYEPDLIAKLILKVVAALKIAKQDVSFSNITVRGDGFKAKAKKINGHLSKMRNERNFHAIDHSETSEQISQTLWSSHCLRFLIQTIMKIL